MPVIQIFAKPPVEGKVKTRLIVDIGAAKATRVYRFCLQHTLDIVNQSEYEHELWLSDNTTDGIFNNCQYHLQQGNNLGERMFYALDRVLSTSSTAQKHPILIGTDCLDLSAKYLNQADNALQQNDIVLLPAVDGGFALIGCRKIEKAIFDNIHWSTNTVLQQLLDNARGLEYRVHLLEAVRDIDTLSDLNHYVELQNLIDKK